MFILVCNYGNTDGDMGSMLIGTYNAYEDAHKAMKSDMEATVAENEWEDGDHKLEEHMAYAMDGDFWDHYWYRLWLLFDSDNPMAYNWR